MDPITKDISKLYFIFYLQFQLKVKPLPRVCLQANPSDDGVEHQKNNENIVISNISNPSDIS